MKLCEQHKPSAYIQAHAHSTCMVIATKCMHLCIILVYLFLLPATAVIENVVQFLARKMHTESQKSSGLCYKEFWHVWWHMLMDTCHITPLSVCLKWWLATFRSLTETAQAVTAMDGWWFMHPHTTHWHQTKTIY